MENIALALDVLSAFANYVGADGFTFQAGNGTSFSSPAIVSITVNDTFASLQLSGIPSTVYPGVAQTLTVRAIGASGATFTGFTGTVKVSNPSANVVITPNSYTYTPADMGVHAFSVVFNTGGTYTVTVTSGSVTASVTTRVSDYILPLSNTGATTRGMRVSEGFTPSCV